MTKLIAIFALALIVAFVGNAEAGPLQSPSTVRSVDAVPSTLVLAQSTQQSESFLERMRRVWRKGADFLIHGAKSIAKGLKGRGAFALVVFQTACDVGCKAVKDWFDKENIIAREYPSEKACERARRAMMEIADRPGRLQIRCVVLLQSEG